MRHIVALSGGKDSTAMALRLAEIEPRDYTYVCTPTGNEPPAMFAHWRLLGEMLGKPIMPLMKHSLRGLVLAQRAIPNHRQRWCTRMIKLGSTSRNRASAMLVCGPTKKVGQG